MHPHDLYINVKSKFTYNQMTADFMRSLKGVVQTWLWELQVQQIWMDSIGTDGRALGFYSNNSRNPTTWKKRVRGQRYEMDDTGALLDNMKVIIDVGKKEIIFQNNRRGVNHFRFDKDVFMTDRWFGLTQENYDKFMYHNYRWVMMWTKEHIRHGKSAKTYGFQKPKS